MSLQVIPIVGADFFVNNAYAYSFMGFFLESCSHLTVLMDLAVGRLTSCMIFLHYYYEKYPWESQAYLQTTLQSPIYFWGIFIKRSFQCLIVFLPSSVMWACIQVGHQGVLFGVVVPALHFSSLCLVKQREREFQHIITNFSSTY